jgi:hypothetical protein
VGIMAKLTFSDWGHFMAILGPKSTGLPFVVYISPKAGARHDARIRIARTPRVRGFSQMLSVAIRPTVRVVRNGQGPRISQHELDLMTRWIELNRDVLLKHWDGEILSTVEVLQALKPIKA